ncbi:MAG: 4Fe-4S dicluster domain-containing protein [Anaerolineae bacterium]
MKIQIQETCQDPRECRLCLDRCPEKVFGIYPRQRRKRGIAAAGWVIQPMFASRCNLCRECETFCPPHAITLH